MVAIEEGLLLEYIQNPDKFVNLLRPRRRRAEGQLPRLEVEQRHQRRRQEAVRPRHRRRRHGHVLPQGPVREGRPAHRPRGGRQAVADLGRLHRAGKKFQAKNTKAPPSSTARPTSCSRRHAERRPAPYFDKSNKLVVETNPAVKTACDTAKTARRRPDRQAQRLHPAWNAGFKNGAFATMACPAWMIGCHRGTAGRGQGQVGHRRRCPAAAATGAAPASAVPKQSKHPKEAAELAKFLTGKRGPDRGLQGRPAACRARSRLCRTRRSGTRRTPYFNDAPVGQIFGAAAKDLQAGLPRRRSTAQVRRPSVENVIAGVDQGSSSPDAGLGQGRRRRPRRPRADPSPTPVDRAGDRRRPAAGPVATASRLARKDSR